MNKENLQVIIKKYINSFEFINNQDNDETYKWEIAQKFQSFDLKAEDYADMLNRMWKTSGNLIDSSQQLPFYAMIEYARKEPDTVREMFRKLFSEEHLDPEVKQKVINDFLVSSEELRLKYYPASRLYKNDQRSVMMYLFLRYPNSNFGYKATQAKSFADCISFYEDWGTMTNFHLDIYERMCEQVLEEIKKNSALLETHRSRYDNTDRELHPDDNLHILLFDIIFSSQTYGFYDGITFDPINAKSRRLYFERVAKAKELAEKVKKAQADSDALDEAKDFIDHTIAEGMTLQHKAFGKGTVIKCDGSNITVYFERIDDTKTLNLAVVIGNGLGSFDDPEITDRIKSYAPILNHEGQIPSALANAVDELQPYLEYLD